MNKKWMRTSCVVASAIALLTVGAYSQQKSAPDSTQKDLSQKDAPRKDAPHTMVQARDLKWTPIMKGCDVAQVSGDYNVEGAPFVLRIRCADGAKIPAHWHPTDENITVLRGTFLMAMGESYDETKLQPMPAGNFALIPKGMRHFALNRGETVVQIHGSGPFKVNWVNPAEVIPADAAPATPKPKS